MACEAVPGREMSWVTVDRIVSEEIVRDDGIRRHVAESGRPLRSPATDMSDDGLLAKLRDLGVDADREKLAEPCDGALSAEHQQSGKPPRGWSADRAAGCSARPVAAGFPPWPAAATAGHDAPQPWRDPASSGGCSWPWPSLLVGNTLLAVSITGWYLPAPPSAEAPCRYCAGVPGATACRRTAHFLMTPADAGQYA